MSSTSNAAAVRPNIIVITVDELRFPTTFPEGVHNADQFLEKFMPNLHRLWATGVKFTNCDTASSACSPARGTMANELRAPLPPVYLDAQQSAAQAFIKYVEAANASSILTAIVD